MPAGCRHGWDAGQCSQCRAARERVKVRVVTQDGLGRLFVDGVLVVDRGFALSAPIPRNAQRGRRRKAAARAAAHGSAPDEDDG